MTLKYYGLSCFQLRFGDTTLVTDPFDPREVGLSLPSMKADVVVYTQAESAVSKKARAKVSVSDERAAAGKKLYEIFQTGEYEIGGIFVRVLHSPGVVIVTVDDVNICYLGLAKDISKDAKFDELGSIHYLIAPVGDGDQFMDWKRVETLIKEIEPFAVIPSCFALEGITSEYKDLKSVDEFAKELGFADVSTEKKIKLHPGVASDESQYKLIVLETSKS